MSFQDLPGLPARYRIRRFLGKGSSKRVYLAEDGSLDRLVAVAVIDSGGHAESHIELLREVRAMSRIGDHPHVVSLYDVIETSGPLYIVSQYLPGGDLEMLLEEREGEPLSYRRSLKIAIQICKALETIHECGMTHHDIKPANIFLSECGDALLGDFEFAQYDPARWQWPADEDDCNTPRVEFLGTPEYMAPETIAREPWQSASDLYSLGCVLYELLIGAPPYRGRNADETLRLHQLATPVPASVQDARIPTTLSDLILKLLSKKVVDRPSNARDVRAALEGSLALGPDDPSTDAKSQPLGRRAIHDPPFSARDHRVIARRQERTALRRALDRSAAGEPRLVLIRGEAGIGKSELVRDLRFEVGARGGVFLMGCGYEDSSLPFRGFVEALLPLAGRLGELPKPTATHMREFLYREDRCQGDQSFGDGNTRRHQLFLSICEALILLSRARPLVLVLDDLHWMDSASIDLLSHLIESSALRVPNEEFYITFIACARPVGPEHPLGSAVDRMQCQPISEMLELTGLDSSAVYEFVAALGVTRPSDQLIQTVMQITRGNPLFVREMINHLDRNGALQDRKGFTVSTVSSRDATLPTTVTSAISGRVEGLSEACRRVLLSASVIGTRFDLQLLSAIEDCSADDLLGVLEEAVDQRLLVDTGHVYAFQHPVVHRVFQQMLGVGLRERIHLRVATVLLKQSDANTPEQTVEIAHHLVHAGRLADQAEVFAHVRSAAEQALSRFAWREATKLLHAALELARVSEIRKRSVRAELYRSLAYTYYCLFDAGPCLHYYDLAIEAFRVDDDAVGLAFALNGKASAALRLGFVSLGDLGDIEPLERALESLGERQPGLRARILGTLAERYWSAGHQNRARELSGAAMEVAQRVGDFALCAQVIRQVGLADFKGLHLTEALANCRKGEYFGRLAEDPIEVDQSAQRIGLYALMAGKLAESEKALGGSLDIARSDSLLTSAVVGSLAVVRGNYELAEKSAQETLEKIRQVKQAWAGVILFPALACSRIMRNDATGANAALDLLMEPGLVFEDPRLIESITLPLRNLIDVYVGIRSSDHEIEIPDVEDVDDLVDMLTISGLCAQVERTNTAPAPKIPALLHRVLEIADQRGVVFTPGWPFMIKRIRALAASLDQRFDQAQELFDCTIRLAGEVGAMPELARARLDYALMMTRRDQSGDRERAGKLANLAIPKLRRFAPERFVVDAEKLASYFAR